MIYLNRKVIIPTIALVAIMGAIAMGTMPVSAESNVYGNLVQKIAQRFNLKEADVQQVLDQVREEHHVEMTANWESRLSELVTQGKITEAQKTLIIAKHDELQKTMDSLRNLSPDDRRLKLQQVHEDIDVWAKSNNIDLRTIGLFGIHGGFGRGFRMGFVEGKLK